MHTVTVGRVVGDNHEGASAPIQGQDHGAVPRSDPPPQPSSQLFEAEEEGHPPRRVFAGHPVSGTAGLATAEEAIAGTAPSLGIPVVAVPHHVSPVSDAPAAGAAEVGMSNNASLATNVAEGGPRRPGGTTVEQREVPSAQGESSLI